MAFSSALFLPGYSLHHDASPTCQVMSELAGYYGGITAIVSYLLPWLLCVILVIMLYRLIQVISTKQLFGTSVNFQCL